MVEANLDEIAEYLMCPSSHATWSRVAVKCEESKLDKGSSALDNSVGAPLSIGTFGRALSFSASESLLNLSSVVLISFFVVGVLSDKDDSL